MSREHFEGAVEEHLQRFRKPDGYCLHCQRLANRHHPVGPVVVATLAPDDGGRIWTHEFCNWECLGRWAAAQAGGVFVVDRN
jgi:hypothetical protein